ncbi:MAG: DUF167 domain-containing protein [Verrucomicrobiales bacterium]|nr:DUF167 domain-containing protein [Verrucomicrobiales bacterium]
MSSACLQPLADRLRLNVKVQPRATQTAIAGEQGNELRVRVAAPPVDDAANEAVLRFLADALGLPRRSVQLVRGRTSTHKVFEIHGLKLPEAARRLGIGP